MRLQSAAPRHSCGHGALRIRAGAQRIEGDAAADPRRARLRRRPLGLVARRCAGPRSHDADAQPQGARGPRPAAHERERRRCARTDRLADARRRGPAGLRARALGGHTDRSSSRASVASACAPCTASWRHSATRSRPEWWRPPAPPVRLRYWGGARAGSHPHRHRHPVRGGRRGRRTGVCRPHAPPRGQRLGRLRRLRHDRRVRDARRRGAPARHRARRRRSARPARRSSPASAPTTPAMRSV